MLAAPGHAGIPMETGLGHSVPWPSVQPLFESGEVILAQDPPTVADMGATSWVRTTSDAGGFISLAIYLTIFLLFPSLAQSLAPMPAFSPLQQAQGLHLH